MAVMLGPTDPDPTMDVSNLDIVKTVVQDSPHKLFIGGLPCDWTEDQVCMRVSAVASPLSIVVNCKQEKHASCTAHAGNS